MTLNFKKSEGFKFNHLIFMILLFVLSHLAIWFFISSFQIENMIPIFNHWDAAHYSNISSGNAYSQKTGSELDITFAFFPLWPFLVKMISQIIPHSEQINYSLIGAGLSFSIFILFLISIYKSKFQLNEMRPKSWMGWFILLFSPASYIFHTNHTEALFLLLSWFAFSYAIKGNSIKSSIFSGLCALTKNQGVIVSVLVACIIFSTTQKKQEKFAHFILSGIISFSLFSIWPIFQYIQTGDPIAFLHVQKHWQHVENFSGYVRTFFYNFRYVIQLDHGTRSFRAILFYIGIGVSIHSIFFKKESISIHGNNFYPSKFFGFYILICSLLLPAQGFLENTFRFHLILFPLWFLIGDFLHKKLLSIKSSLLSKTAIISIVAAVFILNLYVTYQYGLGEWAY